jgi:hypothetical protein
MLCGKDGNRPLLMKRAFADDAELEMVVRTDAISFPSSAKGQSAIEDIFVRRFGMENGSAGDSPFYTVNRAVQRPISISPSISRT